MQESEGRTFFYRRGEPQRGTPATSLLPGQRFGDHELLRVLGQGGMGQVWEARQLSLGRRVALKVVHPDRLGEARLELFAREARAGGRLSHPGIVAVHGHGVHGGLAWISMELVEGARTLRDFLNENRDQEVDADHYRLVAQFLLQVADALQSAHDVGVIHRDIKPQNILIAPDDRPRLADFGLAKIQDETALSRTGDFAGTYAYSSPEQVLAGRMRVDHRTDVFSLGVVMYEMLSGRRPFEGDSAAQLGAQVLTHDPPPIAELRSRVPRDLSVICQKCLEKPLGRRYASMAELAADLRRHLAREPILARPPGRLRKLQLWVQRHPTRSLVSAVVLLALVAISALALRLYTTGESLRTKTAEAAESAGAAHRSLDVALSVEEFLGELLEASSPYELGQSVKVVELLDSAREGLEKRFADRPEARVRLQGILASSYSALAMHEVAVEMCESALPEVERLHGGRSAQALELRAQLARSLEGVDRWQAARELALAVRRESRELLGVSSRACVEATMTLARGLVRRSKHAEAEALLHELLNEEGESEARTIEQRLEVLGLLATAVQRQGRFDDGQVILEYLVEERQRRYGANSHWALWSRQNLANHWMLRGRPARAEALLGCVVESIRDRFGEAHPEALVALGAWCRSLESQGRYEEAEEGFRAVLGGFESRYGGGHPATALPLQNLAWVVQQQGRLEEAEALYRRCVEAADPASGRGLQARATASTNLALLHLRRGALDEALAFALEGLAQREELRGPGHPDSLDGLAVLASVRERRGERERAEVLRRRALDGYFVVHGGKDHPIVVGALNNLGWLLLSLGELTEARELLEQAVAMEVRLHGRDGRALLKPVPNLARVCQAQREWERAEELFRWSVELNTRYFGPDAWSTLWDVGERGAMLLQMGRLEEAEEVFAGCLDTCLDAFGEEHVYTARCQALLAGALGGQGRWGDALPLIQEATETRRRGLEEIGPVVLYESLGQLGRCLGKLGRHAEAEQALLEMRAGLEALAAPPAEYLRWSTQLLVELYEAWGRPEEAAAWRDEG